jgi:hypothetical protein
MSFIKSSVWIMLFIVLAAVLTPCVVCTWAVHKMREANKQIQEESRPRDDRAEPDAPPQTQTPSQSIEQRWQDFAINLMRHCRGFAPAVWEKQGGARITGTVVDPWVRIEFELPDQPPLVYKVSSDGTKVVAQDAWSGASCGLKQGVAGPL